MRKIYCRRFYPAATIDYFFLAAVGTTQSVSQAPQPNSWQAHANFRASIITKYRAGFHQPYSVLATLYVTVMVGILTRNSVEGFSLLTR